MLLSSSKAATPLLIALTMSFFWGCTTQSPLHPPKTPTDRVPSSQIKSPPVVNSSLITPATVAAENIPAPRIAESPEETALLQGKLLLSQGMLLAAWQQWANLANASGPGIDTAMVETAWKLIITSYFQDGDTNNTPNFLQEMPTAPLTTSQIRILQQIARLHSKERLHDLLKMQTDKSILIPFLQLALGDRLAQKEQENEAQALWREAQQFAVVADEASRRLSENSTAPPLRVGLLLPLNEKWVRIGEHLLRAAQKALADYRDVSIQLLIADSGDSEKTSRDAMNYLVSKRVDVVVGPVFHASVQPAAEIAASNGIPIITMNPHSETSKTLTNVFSNAFHPAQQAKTMAEYAVLEKQYQRIVILAPDSEYGHSMTKTFSDRVWDLGGSVVHIAYFPTDTLDFSAWLKPLEPEQPPEPEQPLIPKKPVDPKKLLDPDLALELIDNMEPVEPPKPDFDAMFLPAPAKQIRLLAPQAAFFGVGVPDVALLGTALWNNSKLLTEGTDYLDGAVFCDTSQTEKDWFGAAFMQSWEEEPATLATLTYDGVAVLAQLLRDQRLGGPIWYNGLTQTLDFQGANGPLWFLSNGQSRRNYHLFDIYHGKIRFLQTAPKLVRD